MAFPRLSPVLLATLLAGCGTLPDGRQWGRDVTLTPGWAQVERAAVTAAADRGTWLPAAGAGLLLVSGADGPISDWAVEQRPLFGADPGPGTDRLREASRTLVYATALLTPSGPEPGPWVRNKIRGMGIEGLAGVVTTNVTGVLKRTVSRKEPSVSEPQYESFTSAHATLPFSSAALVRRNTAQLHWTPPGRNAVNTAALVSAAGSAWGRVEMGLHYPSDQLAGAAIGNFLGLFVHDLFMGLGPDQRLTFELQPGRPSVAWRLRY